MNEEQIKRITELLSQLKELSKETKLELPKIFRDVSLDASDANKQVESFIKSFAGVEDAASEIKAQMSELRTIFSEDIDFSNVAGSLLETLNEVTSGTQGVNTALSSVRGLFSTAQKLAQDQAGESQLSVKELESLSKSFDEYQQNISAVGPEGIEERIRLKEEELENTKQGTKAELKLITELAKLRNLQEFLNQQTKERFDLEKSITETIEQRIGKRKEEEKTLKKQAGLTGAIVTASKELLQVIGLGAVADFINFESIESQIREKTKELSDKAPDGEIGFSGRLKVLGTGLSAVKKEAIGALKDPATSFIFLLNKGIKLIKNIGKAFVDTLKSVDNETGKLAKTFNLTYREALAIRQELVATAAASNELFVTSKALQETLSTINANVGTRSFVGLNEQLQQSVIFLTKLREESGLLDSNIQSVAELTFVTGQSAEDLTADLLGSVNVRAGLEGVLLNEKDIFKDIEGFSKATLLSLSQTPREIGRSFVQARLLGASLSQIEGISGNLVNFESSITDELNAQVITGKALNLNAARFAALNNDAATVAKEIREQVGTAAEFAGMNRIEQEAIAKAVGVGRDELAQMLFTQEQIAGLQGEEAEKRKKALNLLVQQRGIDGAIGSAGEEQIKRLEKQVSVQEQFTASVNKLKEIFVDIATIVGPLFSGIASVIGKIASLISSVQGSGEILGGAGLGAALGTMVLPGLGTAIGGTIGALGGAAAYAVDDGYFPPMEGGEDGYDRTLLTPEGTFKFNNKDNILAGTDSSLKPTLPRRQSSSGITTTVASNYNQPINTTNVTSATKQQKIDMTEVISTIKKSNELIERQTKVLAEGQAQIRKQKTNLTVGATDLGTQISVNSSRVQYG